MDCDSAEFEMRGLEEELRGLWKFDGLLPRTNRLGEVLARHISAEEARSSRRLPAGGPGPGGPARGRGELSPKDREGHAS